MRRAARERGRLGRRLTRLQASGPRSHRPPVYASGKGIPGTRAMALAGGAYPFNAARRSASTLGILQQEPDVGIVGKLGFLIRAPVAIRIEGVRVTIAPELLGVASGAAARVSVLAVSVINGATTMWERWNSWTKETGFGNIGMNSFNHYAYGAVGGWMYRTIGGIDFDSAVTAFNNYD
jgi:hypothetical protein